MREYGPHFNAHGDLPRYRRSNPQDTRRAAWGEDGAGGVYLYLGAAGSRGFDNGKGLTDWRSEEHDSLESAAARAREWIEGGNDGGAVRPSGG
jgi:hypothetical protein